MVTKGWTCGRIHGGYREFVTRWLSLYANVLDLLSYRVSGSHESKRPCCLRRCRKQRARVAGKRRDTIGLAQRLRGYVAARRLKLTPSAAARVAKRL